jgi:hypothetical protein
MTKSSGLSGFFLIFLLFRLTSWAFLLPPWGGFDEPAHQGLVETCAAHLGWPRFQSVTIPERLIRAIGAQNKKTTIAAPHANYETQQSPSYYLLAGRLLSALPSLSPIAELYLLRLLNAALALLVGIIILWAVRGEILAELDWLPIAWLGFVPGYAIAMVRVSNDALCALLVTAALAAIIRDRGGRVGVRLIGAGAAGLAPWAKLYGAAVLPAAAFDAIRKRAGRALALVLLAVPPLLLAVLSFRLNGTVVPLQENLIPAKPIHFAEVPWLLDMWTIAKTQIWVSGQSTIVFPTWAYPLPIAILLLAVIGSIRHAFRPEQKELASKVAVLLATLALFVFALAYHATRNYAANRVPGGSGGWYLWAMALPETLLFSLWAGDLKRRAWLPSVFALFLSLLILGDVALFFEAAGGLITSEGNHHILGFHIHPMAGALGTFFRTRPPVIGAAAIFAGIASWLVGGFLVIFVYRLGRLDHSATIC